MGSRVLEVGVGTGFVAGGLKERALVVGSEVDLEAARLAKSLVEVVACWGASAFRPETFDLVLFNPPYLPSEGIGDPATDGGVGGVEVLIRTLPSILWALKPGGQLLFILSSLSDRSRVFRWLEERGYVPEILETRRLFFEELYVVRVVKPSTD